MLITEWNTEDAKEVWFEEGFEKGEQIGEKKGKQIGEQIGEEKGEKKGEQKVIDLLKSGKSPEEIIRDNEG